MCVRVWVSECACVCVHVCMCVYMCAWLWQDMFITGIRLQCPTTNARLGPYPQIQQPFIEIVKTADVKVYIVSLTKNPFIIHNI